MCIRNAIKHFVHFQIEEEDDDFTKQLELAMKLSLNEIEADSVKPISTPKNKKTKKFKKIGDPKNNVIFCYKCLTCDFALNSASFLFSVMYNDTTR